MGRKLGRLFLIGLYLIEFKENADFLCGWHNDCFRRGKLIILQF